MKVTTVDYHAGGEPFRIVTGGAPALKGKTVLERRRWALENCDEVRKLLVNEPRGHADMYGGFVTPPDDKGADLGVVVTKGRLQVDSGQGKSSLAIRARHLIDSIRAEYAGTAITEPATPQTNAGVK